MHVYVVELVPQFEEPFLQYGCVVFGEVAEEVLEHFYLFMCEIVYGVEFVYVAQKSEYLSGIGKVLVNVIEVAQHQLAPTVELLQCLFFSRDGAV